MRKLTGAGTASFVAMAILSPCLHAQASRPADGARCRDATARLVAETSAKVLAEDGAGTGVAFSHPGTPQLSLLCQDSLFGVALGAGISDPPDAWFSLVGQAAHAALGVDAGAVADTSVGCVETAERSKVGGSTETVRDALIICHAGDGQPVSITVTSTSPSPRRPSPADPVARPIGRSR